MADDIELNLGTGGSFVKTDEDGSNKHWQYVKLAYGADNTQTRVEASAPLPVDDANTVSTNNSRTATLGISANWTATGDDVSNYAAITVQVDASHDSAANGMTFEFSSDNTNWDDVYTFTYTAADGARRFQFPVTAQYFRNNYTNGGTGQSHFRVQTILHKNNVLTSVHRVGDNVDPDRSAQLTKTVILAQQAGSGDFIPVDSTAAGNLKVAVEEGVYTPADAESNPTDTIKTADHNMVWNGSTWDRQKGDTTDGTLVNLGTNNDVTVTGTVDLGATDNAVLDSIDTNTTTVATAVVSGAMQVQGDVTHDSPDVRRPVKIGAVAESDMTTVTAVGDGDRTNLYAGIDGVLFVQARDAEGAAPAGNPFLMAGDTGSAVQNVAVDASGNLQVDLVSTTPDLMLGTDFSNVLGTASLVGTDASAHGASQIGIRAMGTDGTNDQQIKVTSNGDVFVVGNVDHDAADFGKPLKIGARAFQANPSLVANGDRVDIQAGRDGGLIVHPDSPLDGFVNNNASATDTSNTSVIAAQGAGIYTYLTDIIVTNASATDTEVIIKDGTTEKLRISAPANGGAVSVGLRSPIAGTANTAWQFASVDAVTTMYVFMSGFTSRIA